jgi:hypothetical protein
MNTADLITAFLSNEMNPAQEREFLLSVAASDSQRLALKSHVMLDRVLAQQVQRASVPDSVRGVIFSAAAASLAEPLPASQGTAKSLSAQSGFAARLRAFATRTALPMVATMLTLAGFAAGYYTSSESVTNRESGEISVAVPAASATPRVIDPAPATAAPLQSPMQHDVEAAVQKEATPAVQRVSHPAELKANATHPVASSPSHTHVSSSAARTPSTSAPSVANSTQPGSSTTTDASNEPSGSSVDNNDPNMQVKMTIRKPSDTNSNKSESSKGKP